MLETIATWVRPKTAPVKDLRAQFESATAAHAAALTALEAAQGKFDETGDQKAAQALTRAREAAATTAEHLGRARRLFDAAEAKIAADAKAVDDMRMSVIVEELAGNVDPVDDELLEREVEALLHAVSIRLEREKRRGYRSDLRGELSVLHARHGVGGIDRGERLAPLQFLLAERLEKETRGLPVHDAGRRIIQAMADCLKKGFMR